MTDIGLGRVCGGYEIVYRLTLCSCFFFNDTATTEIYTLSLHDALPILDSRLHDNLELNFDSTFDVHENVLKTFNIELGIKPIDSLYLFFDRRYTKNSSTFFIAGADWNLGKGWRIQATTRYDEKEEIFRENNFSLKYDNPCKCWSSSFDIIDRKSLSQGLGGERELKYVFRITLRGLGELKTGVKQKLIHREFKSIK